MSSTVSHTISDPSDSASSLQMACNPDLPSNMDNSSSLSPHNLSMPNSSTNSLGGASSCQVHLPVTITPNSDQLGSCESSPLTDPWNFERSTLQELPRGNIMQTAPSYDPLNWTPSDVANDLHSHYPNSTDPESSLSLSPSPLESTGRPHRTKQPPGWMRDYFANTVAISMEPTCYANACQSEEWRAACDEEMASIHKNNTWILSDLPSGKVPLTTKWVFKAKQDAEGRITKRKARLVVHGCEQTPGLDYEETFAPVVKWGTLRGLAALAAQRGYSIYHLDVRTAFLHDYLKEEVYIYQPEGYVNPNHAQQVCLLQRALYGLRHAPCAWYERIDSFLVNELGFERGIGDTNLYRHSTETTIILIALYVDDILLTGSSTSAITTVKDRLESSFEMSELSDGTIVLYLKAELVQVPSGIFMTQRGYCCQILETFGLFTAHPVSTPMVDKPRLLSNMQEDLVDPTLYRSMVGKLLHLTHTCPDITYSVSIVSRFMQMPQSSHLLAIKRIFRYLAGTWDSGILYDQGGMSTLVGYSDSDYAGDVETS
jgi:hypothetical protein